MNKHLSVYYLSTLFHAFYVQMGCPYHIYVYWMCYELLHGSLEWCTHAVHFRIMTFILEKDSSPSIAGPGISPMYHILSHG